MKILLTGGAGYVGSIVAQELEKAGHRLWIVDNFSTSTRAVQEVLSGAAITWREGELGDAAFLEDVIGRTAFDACVHLAGSARVDESMARPALYYRNNVSAGLVLLETLVRHGVGSFVFSSTAAVYGAPRTVPIEEDHPKEPTNCYGETKLAFERMLHWHHLAGGPGYVCLRYFNAAGAASDASLGERHDPETHLIPNLLSSAATGAEVPVFGDDYPTADGTCVRDYVHVEDLARAHRLALELLAKERRALALNLGSGDGASVREVMAAVERVTKATLRPRIHPRRAGDPPVLVASRRRAEEVLGWVPQASSLDHIIESAWRWQKQRSPGKGA